MADIEGTVAVGIAGMVVAITLITEGCTTVRAVVILLILSLFNTASCVLRRLV
jgi:hypothetical protein